ncbi:hypothetical protein ABZW03_21965 [Kitasatospora sp. NPDC004799]|uniref:hypothetical protein n=1 Tax=Kitasatospora sp. NPDC004799 TaxID=3154460 RepID=UPI0033B39815
MAELTVQGGDLVLRLSWWERLVTGTAPVRAPLTAVEDVAVLREPWRVFRGFKEKGLLIPDTLCLGVWRHPGGRDFLALRRPRTGEAVVQVDLRAPSPFARIAVQSRRAPQTTAAVRAAQRTEYGTEQEPDAPEPDTPEPEPAALPGGRPGAGPLPAPVPSWRTASGAGTRVSPLPLR